VQARANWALQEMFGQPYGETVEALGERVAAVYKELSYPSAAKFKAALTKRGLNVPDAFVRQLVGEQGSRQLVAPPPRFTGKVTAQQVDDRWAGDVLDLQSKTRKQGAPVYILLVQDIFSRFLFATALRSKAEVEAAFLRLLRDTKRKPQELNTDLGSEFMNASFQAMLEREGIYHVPKEGPQDLATLDRAIGELRAVLSRRTTDGGEWYDHLEAAVKSMNGTEHSALFNRDPDDVAKDEDLEFDLRYKNAQMQQHNVELAKTRGENLEQQGAFRTYLAPTFRRRAGQQNWSEEIHQVESAGPNGRVVDTEGESFRMSMVKAVPSSTQFVQVPEFAQGGSRKVEERRKEALQRWLPMLLDRIHNAGSGGLSLQRASRETAAVPGFVQALRNQRANLLQFAQLWPDQIRIEKRGTQNILYALVARARPQEPQAAAAPRVQEPPESREERNARLDALLAANRANMEAAQERAKQKKLETLKQLRATQPRTERDLR